ncbi:MAG: SIMPL domain-containing protein [Oscillospiraceae bacterium]|nr:SIMPL domain-containing protein [Oscillospiraceae bacterium]
MPKTVTVKGVGTASVKPDYIVLSIDVTSQRSDYTDSINNANERIRLLQNAAVSMGFAKEDLKTLSFNVNTKYETVSDGKGNYKKVFRGYSCEYKLKLSFDMDAKRLAKTLTAIAECGANAEFSIAFTVKNPEMVNTELLRSAAENARAKAEILCAAAGVKLGDLLTIDYSWSDINIYSASRYMVPECDEFEYSDAPLFEPEDIKARDSATFVWTIN